MSERQLQALHDQVTSALGEAVLTSEIDRGELTVTVRSADILAVAETLSRDDQFAFKQLVDLSGVDYLSFGQADWVTNSATDSGFSRGVRKADTPSKDSERFAVAYHLISVAHNQRIRIKTFPAGDPPRLDSVISVWASADWYEREVFDLFGVLFNNHPDLRRILTDYGFIGHPFRKDFPLEGHVEVRYDEEQKRVVYQPVTIENRVLVPRVIRDDNRFGQVASNDEAETQDG
ncbi:MAG: NADH-quinone oxidoreductase subunit C [Pseudomonadota bacterium]